MLRQVICRPCRVLTRPFSTDTYRMSGFSVSWLTAILLVILILAGLAGFLESWFHGHVDLPSCPCARLEMGKDFYVYLFCFVVSRLY